MAEAFEPGAAVPRTKPSVPEGSDANQRPTLTPEEALRLEQLGRIRVFAIGLAITCMVALPLVALLGGDDDARAIHLAAIGATLVAAALYATHVTPVRFQPRYLVAVVAIASLTNVTGFYYWGFLSGYLTVVTVSAHLVSTTGQRTAAVVGAVITIVGHLVIGFGTIAGWIADRGLVGSSHLSTFDSVLSLLLLMHITIGATLLGAQTNAVTRRALTENLAAFRDLARREAQLAEARAEARDAMAAAGGFHAQVVGRFRLGELIGRGAMGEVYAAEALDNGQRCALKLLAPHLRRDAGALRRFERESRAIAALSSPHIVRIIDVSPPDASMPYFAMERLEGVDLATLIKEQPMRPLGEVVEIVKQVAAGLDVAHAAGIVHRDLKLQNIFGAESGDTRTWKLLDFGIAKLFDGTDTLTQKQIVGTPGYMAPEQVRGGAVDARTDVYALGVVAYRLLTGVPAVVPTDLAAMLYEIVHRMPPRPSALVDVNPAVECVLALALAKEPYERFVSAGEFARALTEAAVGNMDPKLAARAAAVLGRNPWRHWARRRLPTTTQRLSDWPGDAT